MGADRGILIESAEELEPLAVAKLLAALARRENPGLVILGKQAIDDDANQTGQMLAALLGWPQGTFASGLRLKVKRIEVMREIDEGRETLSLKLPAVITTDLRLNQPRYATLPNIVKARKKPIERLTATSLGVDTTPRTETLKVTEPERQRRQVMVSTVAELVDKLRNEAKVI
jgi:electron transfer flavoprotein beta subunit